jgi:hypothetical protein
MKRMLWGVVVLFAAALPVNAGARDYFTEFEKNFGTTPRGPVLEHYFIVKNTTQQTINLGQARVSCGCVSATVMKNTLAPGESTAVYAAMDTRRIPQAYVTKTVTVYVPFFGSVNEEVQLKVTSIARDDLVMSPDKMAFGTVRKGKEANGSVKFTLYNNPNWQITEATSTGVYVKPEVKQASKNSNEVTYEVTAKLDPACPAGNWTAEIWLKTNAPGIEMLRVPVTVNVTAPINVTPDPLNLNELTVGKETDFKVTLQGTQAFKVLQVKGVDDVVAVKAGSEEARPVHILTISVKPKVSGGLDKLLEIQTDNKEMPTLSIPIKATVPTKK